MLPPRWLVRTALGCACLLTIAVTTWLVGRALMTVVTVTAAVVAALLLSALLQPVHERLRRLRAPDWLASLATVVATLLVVAAVITLLLARVQSQQHDLRDAVAASVGQLRDVVHHSPLPLSEARLDAGASQLADTALSALPGPAAGAGIATQVLSGFALTLFLWFFFLKDGREMWSWLVGCVPRRHAGSVENGGRTVWDVLTSYIRGTTVVAAADALGIGAAMLVLGVPLAASLTCLVFLGAFVPIVGAFVSGALAVGVTLVTLGPVQALALLGCVVLVQQLEGNLLQPLVMGRALRLHPVAIVVSVAVGALVGGVLGALVVVPLVAVGYRLALRAAERSTP